MPVPPLAHEPAATPVAVVLGGPSAEHDVSIVSGTAIADALVGPGIPWSRGSSTSTAAGGGSRTASPRRPAAGRYDDPGRARRGGPVDAGQALERLADARPRPVVLPRAPRPVRRGRDRPGAVRGGRPRLHGFGRHGERDRHGQGDLQAARPRPRASPWTGARSARRAGRGPGRRPAPSSRRSPPGPATRGSWSSRPASAARWA